MGAAHVESKSPFRRTLRWAIPLVMAIVLFIVLWVAIRALMARDELLGAVPLAKSISTSALSVDGSSITDDVTELQRRAASAKSLTSDPVWRFVELTPIVGSNLTAFREASSMIDNVAQKALPPLAELANTFTVENLAPKDGAFNLQPLIDAAPLLGNASAALNDADEAAADIDTSGTVSQITDAVDELVGLVGQTKATVDGLNTAATLLPPMLGADGSRNYLLMSLSNSELRATGGIPGAIALLNATDGRLSLVSSASAASFAKLPAPALPLTDAETSLYGDVLGRYMLDVTATPDFPRTGALTQAIWQQDTGQAVDGVISLDPVALGYILEATGPVDAGAGITLDSENAASVLLSTVYSSFATPVAQDAFFAGATGKIFSAVTAGSADNSILLNSLTRGAAENRIHIWSSHTEEQVRLATTQVAGTVPTDTEAETAFGVYLNDSTGAKMDYYLNSSVTVASAVCRNDRRPDYQVKVKLSSTAPADAATSLPGYVTGGDATQTMTSSGIRPGNIRTNVYIYAPSGSVPYSVSIDGVDYAFASTEDTDHSIAGLTVELTPGQTSTVLMKFVGNAGASAAIGLQHTPMASPIELSLDNFLSCGEIASDTSKSDPSGALSPAPLDSEAKSTSNY
jgi:hypothetical protein